LKGSEGWDASPPFSFIGLSNSSLYSKVSIPKGNVCLQLFRLVAAEDFMGKGLTGGGSRRYLWALFVVCVDTGLWTDKLSGWKLKIGSVGHGK
jgi:hypothetical protein